MTFKIIPLLFCFLVAVSPAWAQAPAASPKDSSIEFRATAWNRDLPELFYQLKGKAQPLPLRRGNITPPQFYKGSPKLVLYLPKMIDGKLDKFPIAELTLNPPPRKNLIVVWMDQNHQYQATVLADEPDRPAAGQMRFVNLYGREIAMDCNGKRLFIAPGDEAIVAAEKGGVGIKLALEIKASGQWQLVMMNGLPVAPNERVTTFIVDPSRLAPPVQEESRPVSERSERPGRSRLPDLFLISETVAVP